MKAAKVIVLALLLSSLLVSPALAANPAEVVTGAVKDALIGFFTDGADSVDFSADPNSSYYYDTGAPATNSTAVDEYSERVAAVQNKYGPSVSSIYILSAYNNDPYKSPTVQKMRMRTAVIGIFFFLIFIFGGGAIVNFSSCKGMAFMERAQYTYTHTPFTEYKNGLIRAFLGILFIHLLFKFIITINYGITETQISSVLDAVAVTKHQWIVYCVIHFGFALEAVFIGMRIMAMDFLAGMDILIGALASWKFSTRFSKELVYYFARITFLQAALVFLSAFGLGIISESPGWAQVFMYIGLIVILLVISGIIVFGFKKALKTGKFVARGVF